MQHHAIQTHVRHLNSLVSLNLGSFQEIELIARIIEGRFADLPIKVAKLPTELFGGANRCAPPLS